MKLYTDKRGYKFARLTKSKPVNGKRNSRCWLVSRLVLMAFVGPCPAGKEACHKNGNPSDNRLSNLYWGTRTDNMADAKRHGTDNEGERNGMSKLTEDDVRRIRSEVAAGRTQTEVAREYGVHQSLISNIVRHRRWSHVK